MTEWNKELEKKILKKSRFTLTLRILRIVLIVYFLYVLYMTGLSMITHKAQIADEHAYYTQLAIEWKNPNVREEFSMRQDEAITAFGTQKFSYNIIKRVGHKEVLMGDVNVTKRLLNQSSNITVTHPGRERLSEFFFSLPEDPRTNEKLQANADPNVWGTLEMLHEGTVGELAFSTTSYMKPEEMIDALKDYELDILWMPLYTGEFDTYTPYGVSGSYNEVTVDGIIGLVGGRMHDGDDFRSGVQINRLDMESLEDSKQYMLRNMEAILDKGESYYEQFLRFSHFEKKYDYLNENGFIVYGAVVTGPVKELLKLQELDFIQGEQLGDVELWNWDNEQ